MFSQWFKTFIHNIDSDFKNELYSIYDVPYLKDCLESTTYWEPHCQMFDTINLHEFNKDSKILDIGIWFGVMTWALKQYGFTNIECTDARSHCKWDIFTQLWNKFEINPFEFEVCQNKLFELPHKYDLILITKTNIFWKTDEIISYTNGNVGNTFQIEGADNNIWTFFSVWEHNAYVYFIDNIKDYLEPNGIAIIQPEPFIYNKWPDKYFKELNLFSKYQKQYYNKIDQPLTDYFVVCK